MGIQLSKHKNKLNEFVNELHQIKRKSKSAFLVVDRTHLKNPLQAFVFLTINS